MQAHQQVIHVPFHQYYERQIWMSFLVLCVEEKNWSVRHDYQVLYRLTKRKQLYSNLYQTASGLTKFVAKLFHDESHV